MLHESTAPPSWTWWNILTLICSPTAFHQTALTTWFVTTHKSRLLVIIIITERVENKPTALQTDRQPTAVPKQAALMMNCF